MAGVRVLEVGIQSTVQDLGRSGLAAMGVGASGAADRSSLRLANRLVGNDEGLAGLEATFGGLVVQAARNLTVAVTGAPCPLDIDGRPVAMNAVLLMRTGSVLHIGLATRGLRTYLAVRGGIDVEPVLGSRSTDTLAGLGPGMLTRDMHLRVGSPPRDFPTIDVAPVPAVTDRDIVLTVELGPRNDWFEDRATTTLLTTPYVVTNASDRVGMRLDGPPLRRSCTDELVPEGTVTGSLQVPPSGRPTLFLADHPVTGGYPVIAVVMSADIDKAAQARPGDHLHFKCRLPGD